MKKKSYIQIIGIVLMLVSIATLFCLDFHVLHNKTVSKIQIPLKEEYNGGNTLHSNLYQGENEYLVLLLGGFSSDQQMMLPLANMVNNAGFSVATLDYSGHGASSGVIGFDNATNGQIVREIQYALDNAKAYFGIENDHIILIGHSMGGRCIIELLESNAQNNYAGVVLIAPQINYDNNVQSSAFTGVTDSEIAPWNDLGDKPLLGAPIYLIGSHFDDIVSTESMQEIYTRLSMCGQKENVTLNMVEGVLHSYEVYAQSVANHVSDALTDVTGVEFSHQYDFIIRVVMWFIGALGIYLLFHTIQIHNRAHEQMGSLHLEHYNKFIAKKLLYWLPSIVVCVIVMMLCVIAPFGSPVMALIFNGLLTGYGIILFVAYKRNKVNGVTGCLQATFVSDQPRTIPNFLKAVASFAIGACSLLFILSRGLYQLYPMNNRLVWLILYSCIMTLHFYIASNEAAMLHAAKVSFAQAALYQVVQYTPVLLMTLLYITLQSFSGVVSTMQNLIILYIAIAIGDCVTKYTNNRWLGAVCSAFLFQSAIITQSALLVMF